LLVFAFVLAAIAVRLQQIGLVHLGWLALALLIASQLASHV
jgi:hypothetical protein